MMMLLEAGANPRAVTTTSGVTPLHLAAASTGGAEAVAALLAHGADPNARESSAGQTPLMFAAGSNRAAAVRALLKGGADPGLNMGQSTADMARGGRAGFFTRVAYPEMVSLLTHLGSTLECLHTHFLDTGDFCKGAGVNDPWAPPAGGKHQEKR